MDTLVSHFEAFKLSFGKNDLATAHKQLTQLKVYFLYFKRFITIYFSDFESLSLLARLK